VKKEKPIDQLIPTRLIDPSERPTVPPAKLQTKRFRFFHVFFRFWALFIGNACLGLLGNRSKNRRDQRTINLLQHLGMVWIRVAQALTLRGASLSTPLGMRLMDLQGRGGAHPFPAVKNIIESELKQKLEVIFDDFEETPFTASTVSQIHRAKLRNEQTWTAVKVQLPQSEEIFDKDLKLVSLIIGLLRFFSIKSGTRWEALFHELKQTKEHELNYYYEAAALETLEKNLKGRPLHVPALYRAYCSKRVLVMAFLQGALLSDVIALQKTDPQRLQAWFSENNINPRKTARRLFQTTYRQVFEDNFFHGDMHTGNIILLRDSEVAVIQCRSAGSLELESLGKQKVYLKSLAEGEYVTAAEIYFLLASRLPRVDLNIVKDRLVRLWRVWETRVHIKTLPYEQKSLTYMAGRVNQVLNDSHFAPLWSFVRLTLTWVHLDNALSALDPELNYLHQLKHYFHRARGREDIAKLKNLPARISGALSALHMVPKRTEEYRLFQEALIRRQAQVVTGSASKLDAVIAAGFGMVSSVVLVLAGFLGFVFAQQHLQWNVDALLGRQLSRLAQWIPQLGEVVWLVVSLSFIILFFFLRVQKNRFSSREHGSNGETL